MVSLPPLAKTEPPPIGEQSDEYGWGLANQAASRLCRRLPRLHRRQLPRRRENPAAAFGLARIARFAIPVAFAFLERPIFAFGEPNAPAKAFSLATNVSHTHLDTRRANGFGCAAEGAQLARMRTYSALIHANATDVEGAVGPSMPVCIAGLGKAHAIPDGCLLSCCASFRALLTLLANARREPPDGARNENFGRCWALRLVAGLRDAGLTRRGSGLPGCGKSRAFPAV